MVRKTRHKARETALKILYQKDITGNSLKETWDFFCKNYDPSLNCSDYTWTLVNGVDENNAEIDSLIQQYCSNWSLDRISPIDRNILRMAIYEMLYSQDVPAKVSIDEAIELGKKYGTERSGAFINGILDKIYHSWLKNEKRI
ncbi:MAG: transcription antitermination factor NusB [Deltaproteobacteria bacterium]|nr:transcription antitermination factor NusB [Deltaproteobacteria bacterium]